MKEAGIVRFTEDALFPNGMNLTLCVAHEMDPGEMYSAQASSILFGMSLCSRHLPIVYNHMMDRGSVTFLLEMIRDGRVRVGDGEF
jgi:hypothetical protein